VRAPPQQQRLRDGRLHLQHGPIDLIIEAFGEADQVEAAYSAAWRRFHPILDELCEELPLLRAQATPTSALPIGRVARRMATAVAPLCDSRFITPMAAVAGAVADEVLESMTAAADLRRAYVNNGGDIALHLEPEERFAIGMVDRPDRPSPFGAAHIEGRETVRGVATSGRHGRSFSLGIADAVTVLAGTAAPADAAATLIANAVDLPGHPKVQRAPARDFDPQSDLGDRLVTRGVGPLAQDEIEAALDAGLSCAKNLRARGLIAAAALRLGGCTRVCGDGVGNGEIVARHSLEGEAAHAFG
jgi:ApbE superfamily uncharacterized protein (UPF0280 family)